MELLLILLLLIAMFGFSRVVEGCFKVVLWVFVAILIFWLLLMFLGVLPALF
ncbi:MAG: hypothetical protein P8X57_08350 [Cyclobacteriaceae bacterium]